MRVEEAGRLQGFLAARVGAQAVQLGPCLGEAGLLLLEDACRRHAGQRVYLDIPEDHPLALRPTERRRRPSSVPCCGHLLGTPVVEQPGLLWASSGPEKG